MARYASVRSALIPAVLFAIASLMGADEGAFRAKPASEYPSHQKQHDFTVGVMVYSGEQEMKEAFGKAKPFRYGVLPVLVVITNNSDDALGLENLKVRFVPSGQDGLEPLPAEELAYVNASTKPKERPSYIPRLPGLGKPKVKKGPLADEIFVQRGFQAPVVPPHSSASGFFYYLTGREPDPIPGASMYLNGLRNLSSGEELFYFEIPLSR